MKEETEWFENWFDSPYYHILYRKRNFSEAERFITNLLAVLHLTPQMKCLDLACGVGRHSVFLNQSGLTVTGVDLSPNNIKEAKKFEKENLQFDVHDMRKPYRLNAFDVVFNLFTSFGYFENYQDNVCTLEAVNASLVSNGRLLLDFMNSYHVLRHLIPEEVETIENIDFHLKRRYDGQHIIKEIYFQDEGKEYAFQEKVQALKLDDFEILFHKSGFEIEEVYGDIELSPFDKASSDRLIIIARKL